MSEFQCIIKKNGNVKKAHFLKCKNGALSAILKIFIDYFLYFHTKVQQNPWYCIKFPFSPHPNVHVYMPATLLQ